jgi:regulator of sirC expression with transglutaminase-like and TPR domain
VLALRAALKSDADVTLDIAALEMAAIETPGLDPVRYLTALDRMAAELASRFSNKPDGPRFVRTLNKYLFDELNFSGNEAAYYDPRNSCLDQVLDRRMGIPITLSVVYIEVARRLERPVSGVGLPGHFVVRYDDGKYATYIDPFHRGKLLSEEDCRQMARQITGEEAEASALEPVGTRYILVRMLNNLRSAYFRSKQYEKVATVMDLLVEAFPANAEYYKARGVARLNLRKFAAAKRDLETYLKYQPDAEDRKEITEQLEAIHRWLGRLN